MKHRISSWGLAAASVLLSTSAHAHAGAGWHDGFTSGVLHPLLGWDHAAVMVAVGLWASTLGRRAMVALPLLFAALMAAGAAAAALGLPLPAQGAGIAASALVLGAAVAFGLRAPLAFSASLVAVFAFFHGHAHGAEMASAEAPLRYALGFVAATLALNGFGMALGRAAASPAGRLAARSAGLLVAAGGAAALLGLG